MMIMDGSLGRSVDTLVGDLHLGHFRDGQSQRDLLQSLYAGLCRTCSTEYFYSDEYTEYHNS